MAKDPTDKIARKMAKNLEIKANEDIQVDVGKELAQYDGRRETLDEDDLDRVQELEDQLAELQDHEKKLKAELKRIDLEP